MKGKSLKSKESYALALFCLATIIFLFSKNFIAFFKIIKEYIIGDIFITYEDFPNIGEWLQITTSVLFSYLLLRATEKSNTLNQNNLNLQKQITDYQNRLERNELVRKLVKMNIDVIFYRGDLKDESNNIRWDKEWNIDSVREELVGIVEVIELYENDIYQNLSMIKDFPRYISLLESIKTYEKDLKNCHKGKHDISGEIKRVKEFVDGLMDRLKQLHELIIKELESQ